MALPEGARYGFPRLDFDPARRRVKDYYNRADQSRRHWEKILGPKFEEEAKAGLAELDAVLPGEIITFTYPPKRHRYIKERIDGKLEVFSSDVDYFLEDRVDIPQANGTVRHLKRYIAGMESGSSTKHHHTGDVLEKYLVKRGAIIVERDDQEILLDRIDPEITINPYEVHGVKALRPSMYVIVTENCLGVPDNMLHQNVRK